MDYEKKIREYMVSSKVDQLYKNMLINLFPELAESEDERIRKEIIRIVDGFFPDKTSQQRQIYIAYLEKQGERKPAWSEEDEKEVAVLEAYIRSKDWSERHVDRALGIVDELVNKVKSLKYRYTWKPSEEQIKTCKEVYADILYAKGFDFGTVNSELNRLEEELKKLKAL